MNLVPCRFFPLPSGYLQTKRDRDRKIDIVIIRRGCLSTDGPVGRSERSCMRIKTERGNKKRALGVAADSDYQVLLLPALGRGKATNITLC